MQDGCTPQDCVGFSVVRGNEMFHMPKLGVVVGVLGIQRWKGIKYTRSYFLLTIFVPAFINTVLQWVR